MGQLPPVVFAFEVSSCYTVESETGTRNNRVEVPGEPGIMREILRYVRRNRGYVEIRRLQRRTAQDDRSFRCVVHVWCAAVEGGGLPQDEAR